MYESKQIADIIKLTAKTKGLKMKDVLIKCGLNGGYMSDLAKSAYPRIDNLCKIADVLNISLDYLVGRKVNSIPTDEDMLIAFYRGCDIEIKKSVIKYAQDQFELCELRSRSQNSSESQNLNSL